MDPREDTVPFADMVGAFTIDDRSPDAPTRASLEGCDLPRARRELLARMRRGPMSLRERAAAMIVARDLGLEGHEGDLATVLLDDGLAPSSRACALSLLLFTPAGTELVRVAHERVGEAQWVALQDEKLALELALQLPAPGMADSLAAQLLRVPEGAREAVWERVERCRREAGLPALAAWRRALTVAELAPLHDRMTAAIIDEADEGTSVVLDMLWQTAETEQAQHNFGRADAALTARGLRGRAHAASGVTHLLEVPGEPARWMVCVPHPGGMTLVAQAEEPAEGALQVNELVILPSEPQVNLTAPRGAALSLNYRVLTAAETRERAVGLARAMRARGEVLPHEVCMLLCLLDGLPSLGEAPARPSTLD
jgi:hypothetical protein